MFRASSELASVMEFGFNENYNPLISCTDLSPIPVRSAEKSYLTSWFFQNLRKRAFNMQTASRTSKLSHNCLFGFGLTEISEMRQKSAHSNCRFLRLTDSLTAYLWHLMINEWNYKASKQLYCAAVKCLIDRKCFEQSSSTNRKCHAPGGTTPI